MTNPARKIGVAIVSYRSSGQIVACLSGLLAQQGAAMRVVVVDNASDDGTADAVRAWAAEAGVDCDDHALGEQSTHESWLTLVNAPVNRGFAHATNCAIELLMRDREIDLFWLLNPDTQAAPDCAAQLLRGAGEGPFALMGGRVLFEGQRNIVQTDGGRVSRLTGKCTSVNWGRKVSDAPMPRAETLDYITGAHCVASRQFIERAGLMREDFFLFYEEVEWAMRRGDLPLRVAPGAVIHHHGGSSIGSASLGRGPSPLALYFSFRNRMRFLHGFNPIAMPLGLLVGLAEAMQLALQGKGAEARAAFAAIMGLPPPAAVRAQLSPEAQQHAFAAGSGRGD